MHNRVVADAFVPAGGRPATIHAGNWREYLVDGEGSAPSSKVIVEGSRLLKVAHFFLAPGTNADRTPRLATKAQERAMLSH